MKYNAWLAATPLLTQSPIAAWTPHEGLETLSRAEAVLRSVTGTDTRISVRLSYARVLGLAGRFEEALAHYRRIGSHDGQAEALANIGVINRNLGRHDTAIACFTEALEIDRRLDDWYWQGEILETIGRTHLAAGDDSAAAVAFEQALAIFSRIRHPKARVVARLRWVGPEGVDQ